MTRLALAAALLAASCSTSYFPRPGPGIKVTLKNGSPTFWKEGKVVQQGMFGSGLAAAMADLPEARRHAETWRSRNITGLVLLITGGAMAVPGAFIVSPGDGLSARNTASVTLISAGFAALIAGLITTLTGQSHLWDALNLYNDRARQPGARSSIAPVPGGLAFRW